MADKIEFAIFCIENLADRLKINPTTVYEALAERSDILSRYIIPNYDILHTQGKDYILDDIMDVMREDGVIL